MKRVLSITLALGLCFLTIFHVRADELTQAQKDYNKVQNSISDKKQELDNINKQQESTRKTVEELDKKMNSTVEQISSLNKTIAGVNSDIDLQKKAIEDTEKALEEGNELFKKRVRAIYINGSESYLEILFGSNDFSDLLGRIETVAVLIEHDKELITGLEEKSRELNNAKLSLEQKKTSIVSLKSVADTQYKVLQEDSDKKKDFMTELMKDKAKYEQLIAQEEQESKAIGNMIKKIKQKQAEEAKKKAQNSKGGTIVTSVNSAIGKLYCVTGRPYPITSPFGPRVHPVTEVAKNHDGMDIGVYSGTPIYALADGVVIYSGVMSGYGNVVMIDHGSLTSLYAHNSSLLVKAGQAVKGGQQITYSGNTGLSTGPHLHFEIRNDRGVAINPSPYYVR